MFLELADNGTDRGRGLVNTSSASKMQLPCKCVDGKIAYVMMPTPNGKVWMRADKFHTMLSDSGYEVEDMTLSGGFTDFIKSAYVDFLAPAAGAAARTFVGLPPTGAGLPGAPGGQPPFMPSPGGNPLDYFRSIFGQSQPVPVPVPGAPAAALPKWVVPVGIGAGVFLLTILLTRK